MKFIARKHRRFGVIDAYNTVLVPFDYDNIETCSNPGFGKMAILKKEALYGILNLLTNQIVTPISYSGIINYYDGHLLLTKDDRNNLMDSSGQFLFSRWYSSIKIVQPDRYQVESEGRQGVVDVTGKVLIPLKYDQIVSLLDNYILKSNGKSELMDENMHSLLPASGYDSLTQATRKLVYTFSGRHMGMVNLKGITICPAEYDKISYAPSNYFLLQKGKYFGMITMEGTPSLPAEYDTLIPAPEISNYSTNSTSANGLFMFVKKEGKYGLLAVGLGSSSIPPRQLLPFEYEELSSLNTQLAIAKKEGRYGVIDISSDKVVLPFKYESVLFANKRVVAYDGAYHFYSANANQLIPEDL